MWYFLASPPPPCWYCGVCGDVCVVLCGSWQVMQHSNFEPRHPLQAEEQETGYDPLHNYNQNIAREYKTLHIMVLIHSVVSISSPALHPH